MGKVRWRRLHLDPLLVACFAILFALPVGAGIVAAGQPRDPDPGPALPQASASTRAAGVPRDLPAFSARSPLERMIGSASLLTDASAMGDAVQRALRDLLDGDAARVMRFVTGTEPLERAQDDLYSAPELDALLDAALGRSLDEARADEANDVAALLVLAAARYPESDFSGAPVVALVLLDRARAGTACVPQLNLAFLLSTDEDAELGREFARAERLCPGDPTPTWTLGQLHSRQASLDEPRLTDAALATFRRLQRHPAGAALGLSGEADTKLRLAYEHEERGEPFSARVQFGRALKLYRDAQHLSRDPGLAAGAARAHAGLREYGSAIAQQRRALAGRETFAPLAARYVEYLERGHRFSAAAGAARPLIARHEFASGRALIGGDDYGQDEDEGTPLSIGVDRLSPVALTVAAPSPGGAALGTVTDLSFVPEFREDTGLTGHDRWCPEWSLPRDLLLTGRPRAALAALPGEDAQGILDTGCEPGTLVAAMAELQLGRSGKALGLLGDAEESEPSLSDLFEKQQNVWRFAGNLREAGDSVRAWMKAQPGNPRAPDRLGEIDFLGKDHAAAAGWFGRSLRLTRSRAQSATEDEADALLKRGTALGFARRRDEALAQLERADEIASRAEAAAHAKAQRQREAAKLQAARNGLPAPDDEEVEVDDLRAVSISYHARVQAGDVLLRARRYAAAAEAYDAAREREKRLAQSSDVLARPEALHNNQAIAEAKLGNDRDAVDAADAALQADPRSPVFLLTSGYALRRAGKPEGAERAYRRAIAADPGAHSAWNDLGVVLGRSGRLDEAVDAFRRSLGARDDYPLAWFNLGVAQSRRAITHLLASQGAYGRAFGLDDGLRDRDRRFITDDAIFFTDLDLSKPLPPQWSYAAGQERAPVTAAGIVLLVLLGLRLGRTLLARSFGGSLAGKLLDPMMTLLGRCKRVPQYTPAIVAVLATMAVFGAGLLRGGTGRDDAVVLLAGVLALTAIVVRGRALLARDAGVSLGQRGWTPGMALGAVVAAFGSAWAPLPVAEPSDTAPAVHWVGPVLTGLAALGLLVLAAWLSTPGTIALASVAIVMTASLLTPTKPLDGGFVASGTAGVAAGLALLGAGLFFVLGVG